ncbi:MAG: class I SAM-dependent methyltransferase [Acidobacteria bacterium]|nr:class I SAM-dependent methyltransferase [Acidobacteriota bacterium]
MKITSAVCRSCGEAHLELILSLGETPLANALLNQEQLAKVEPTYPLDLGFCALCSLVQITETVPPEKLFREYFYFSSFSDTMLQHSEAIARRLIESRRLNGNSLVIEIASNDGYLLQHYQQRGIAVLGIEPAANIARVAQEERGITSISEFFGKELGLQLSRDGKFADVVHANNVLAHVADLNGFVAGLHLILKDEGIASIEVPYVLDMLNGVEFDTIYHEHLCYFSLTALNTLFQRHDLFIADVEHLSVHGGSLRVFVCKNDNQRTGTGSQAVRDTLRKEAELGLKELRFYKGFGAKVEELKASMLALLKELKSNGKRVAAYGASAKGSTLLNYFGIGCETIDFVVDRSTKKQGYYTPGTHLPIYAPEKLLAAIPDYVLLLTWNFADEILAQQSEFRQQGGRFIIPIPELKVV